MRLRYILPTALLCLAVASNCSPQDTDKSQGCLKTVATPVIPPGLDHNFAVKWKDILEDLVQCTGVGPDANCRYRVSGPSALVRQHGWELFRLLTGSPSKSCPSIPYGLTWKTKTETYSPADEGRDSGKIFIQSSQTLSDPGASDASRMIFASAFYRPGLDAVLAAASVQLGERLKISQNGGPKSWNPLMQPPAGFDPIDAIAVKPIWWLVDLKTDGTSCLPVWKFTQPPKLGTSQYLPSKWPEGVLLTDGTKIKPGSTGHCSATNEHGQPIALDSPVIDLNEIFSVPISSSQELNVLQVMGAHLVGDNKPDNKLALLVGMHIISREIENWTWNTYWWVPSDYRHRGRYADGRPPSLSHPWTNYVMDASLVTASAPDASGQPVNAILNPYQEASLPNQQSKVGDHPFSLGGLASNCLSCHQNASFPFSGIRSKVFVPGSTPQPDLSGELSIGFLWSLANYTEPFL